MVSYANTNRFMFEIFVTDAIIGIQAEINGRIITCMCSTASCTSTSRKYNSELQQKPPPQLHIRYLGGTDPLQSGS